MRDVQKAPWPGWNTIRLIGQGSFGTVYEIQRELVDGTVETAAMKVLTIPQNPSDVTEMYSEGYDEESITATFQAHLRSIVAEYTLMRKLDGSANVVNCKDIRYVQHDDGMGWDIFIRMELLTPLLKALPENVPEETVVRLGRDIASALVLCRKHSIIHRDIKPQNIFISDNADYKLGDFGIAKTVEKTMGGTKIGTYKYMAPEVYNNRPYGAAADIYSLGLVMYWLLNERRMPFMPLPPAKILAGQDEQARQRRLSGEKLPPPAHGSRELQRIVLKACAYDPKDRYHTADEMLEDLKGLENRQTTDVNSIEEKASMVETNNSCRKDDVVAGCEDMASDETMATVGAFCQTESGMAGPSGEHAEKMQPRKKPNKSKRKKSHGAWVITVAVILIGTVCGIYGYLHCWFGHVWGATTCTEPATCMRCGSVRGKALGHTWQAATCTKPATCMRCGAVSGKALGHSWLAATCTKPNTCETCGATSGIALGHQWTEATYDAPKTCSVCGLTEGRALKSISTSQVFAEKYGRKKVVAAGDLFVVGIKPDGSCIVAGNPKPNVSSWTGMCSLSACGGTVAGLRSDGTVVCSDPTLNVRDWKDIVQIDYFEEWQENDHHIVGLTSSGKVVAEGTNRYGECDVSGWEGIVDVAAGATCTVGLRSDGTVVACGSNEYGQCNVSDWVGIVDVAAARYAVYGLTSDGHIFVTGQKPLYEGGLVNAVEEVPTPEVSGWDNVVAILAFNEGGDGCDYVVGIREDGTIVTNRSTWAYLDDGDIESFQDVQCIAVASWGYTISVNSQGKVHAVGWDVDGTRIVDTWSLMKK